VTAPADLDDRRLVEEIGLLAEERRKLRARMAELRVEADGTQAALGERTRRIKALRAEFVRRWEHVGPQAVLAALAGGTDPDD
jgi:hypothetical protein